ncbi:sulfatase family protein [Niabella drilacis]|uniref:Arylsulfatase A n=1 Tax=Niabella drilacis (strain DSM 25811 / CCM 8410 / CCUG 62505 / LMG 26954 / E90) TaxID=1285928 RepID=A0A1G7BL92_NIADE|nr:sulfatase [Niabella drilacis]SDE27226.1 Arylsulfatase A [Niabella drilacis]
MKYCFKKFFFISGAILLGLTGFAQKSRKPQPPNILIIVSDDHAFQAIGAYGSKMMETPGIDRLAKEGAVFSNAFVTNSICGPSRACILTGKYSHINGFKDNLSKFDASQDLFVKRLQKAGYQTAWIGKMHLDTKPQGFDYWEILPGQGHYYNPDFIEMNGDTIRRTGYVTNVTTELAEKWLGSRDASKPFCLVVGHKATHRVWMPDLQDLGKFDKKQFPLPDNFYDNYETRYAAAHQDMNIEKTLRLGYDLKVMQTNDFGADNYTRMNAEQKKVYDAYYKRIEKEFISKNLSGKALTEWKYQRYMKDYLATAASLDRNIGELLNYLDKTGQADNTLVIYLSDQGFYMGEHGWFDKRFMYEESFRTPMLARFPGVIKPGTVYRDMVMNIDIAPTALELAGLKVPAEIQGKSMLPLLKNKGQQPRDALYYHYYEAGEHSVIPHFGVRTNRYKLIRFYQLTDKWELFDLEKDPHEMRNVFDDPGYQTVQAALMKRLKELIEEYKDTDAKQILGN